MAQSSADIVARRTARWGIVTRQQLLAAGVSRSAIDRARAGWETLYGGVYFVGVGDIDPLGRLLAGMHAVGNDAAVSHDSASFVRRLVPKWPGEIHITTSQRSHHDIPGLVIHRVRSLPAAHVDEHRGLRVTTVERTLVDIAATSESKLQRALNQACFDRIVDLGLLARMARGRPGARTTRIAVARATRARSPLEDKFFSLIHAAGLEPPISNHPVDPYVPDFTWPAQRLIVETDGWAGHGHTFAQRQDPRRDSHLKGLGYRIIRVPGHLLENRPYEVIATIAAALAS